MAFTATFIDSENNTASVSAELIYISTSTSFGYISPMKLYSSGANTNLAAISYAGAILVNQSNLFFCSGFYQDSSNSGFKIGYIFFPFKTTSYPRIIITSTNDRPHIAKNIEELAKIYSQSGAHSGYEIKDISWDEAAQYLLNKYTSFHTDPVYADATQINYTDGSYEVIRGRMNESEVKNHAYSTLLNTYGTFYKATEQEVSEYYKKQMSS